MPAAADGTRATSLRARPTTALGAASLLVAAACATAPPSRDASPPVATVPGAGIAVPADPESSLHALVGLYAADADTVVLLEDGGRLHLMTADSARRPLSTVDSTRGAFVAPGSGDTIRVRHEDGRVAAIDLRGRPHRRLAVEPGEGGFRIVPRRPVAELRREALAAAPPAQPPGLRAPELVDVTAVDPTIVLDVRYATTDNFMGARFYETPRAFLQRPAAEALARASARLRGLGFGMVVYDAYRPWHVTRMFWDATPDHQRTFVADPANGSRHNRGSAVDLGLYDLATGRPVAMPSGYDEFSPRAAAGWPGGTARERAHRDILRRAMEAEGFQVYDAEWWHFDHERWREYPVLNLTFEELARARQSRGEAGTGDRRPGTAAAPRSS